MKISQLIKRLEEAREYAGGEDLEVVVGETNGTWLIEQENKCDICKIEAVWNGSPLKFQLDHINGKAGGEGRDNLRMICPNCHSQTPTFSRAATELGKKNQSTAYTKQEKYHIVDSATIFRQRMKANGY